MIASSSLCLSVFVALFRTGGGHQNASQVRPFASKRAGAHPVWLRCCLSVAPEKESSTQPIEEEPLPQPIAKSLVVRRNLFRPTDRLWPCGLRSGPFIQVAIDWEHRE